ncbi:hypothetical protein TW95_gp1260 [Pandoravirus inopinatum]|uniref:Uncharacterized protein n=2 Tax=Pandoravirus TaxID=2060084 RepID=A0A0B5J328_9VIRU|nr:hypothetical protein TW95_gp1260 [Pandoravirus inopinatum]AJF97994.1 hypothetical protein [Pandoravirus inopinatum]
MAWQCTAVAAALWQYGGDADNNKKAHSPWGWRAKKAIGHGRNPIVFLRKKTDNNDYKKQQQQQKGPVGVWKDRALTKRRKEGPLLKKNCGAAVLVVRARACATKAYADKKKNKKKGQKAACMGGRLAGEAGAHRPFFSLSPAPHGQPPSKKVGCRGKGVKGRLGTHPLQTTTATARTRRTTRLFLSLKKRNKKTKELAKEDHEQKDRTRRLRQPGKKKQEQNKGKHTRHARRREHGEARRVARGQGANFRAPRPVERPAPAERPVPTAPTHDARPGATASTRPRERQTGATVHRRVGADAHHHHSAARRVSTPAAHVHVPRAPSAASVTAAAAAIDESVSHGGAGTGGGGTHPAHANGAPHAYPPASPRLSPSQRGPARPPHWRAPMAVPDAAATSAEDEGEQMCVRALEEAQARIVAEREEIARIEVLLADINEMRAGDGPDAEAFDDEDVREVEAEIAARQQVLKAMEVDLAARIDKYETEVSVVANAIRKRASVLKTAEHRTRVLSENPRLMTFFAHKQRDLIEIRKNLYDALAQDPPSAPSP